MITVENTKAVQLALLDRYMDGNIIISGDKSNLLISKTYAPIREYIEVELVTRLLTAKKITILTGITL